MGRTLELDLVWSTVTTIVSHAQHELANTSKLKCLKQFPVWLFCVDFPYFFSFITTCSRHCFVDSYLSKILCKKSTWKLIKLLSVVYFRILTHWNLKKWQPLCRHFEIHSFEWNYSILIQTLLQYVLRDPTDNKSTFVQVIMVIAWRQAGTKPWWSEPEGCFTNVSQALQNNLIYGENSKLKLCACAQSMALGTCTKFKLEILIRSTISAIHNFRENILGSSRNVSETTPRTNADFYDAMWHCQPTMS